MTQSTSGRVSREKRGQIMLIGLDRASKRNAFDMPMLDDLCLAYGEFERDSEARVALVFAHGEHFTAGLDLANVAAQFAAGWKIPAGGCDPWGVFGGPRVSKPVIVAAQGYCYTIGIELMLASDINLCASNTRFAQMEVQRGIFPFGGATLRMHQSAGWGNAMRWLLTGDEFDAHEAYRLGLIQQVQQVCGKGLGQLQLTFGFLGVKRQLQYAAIVPVGASLQVFELAPGVAETTDDHLRQRRAMGR